MPSSTYATVFSSFTSRTATHLIPLKKAGWGAARQSCTRKTKLSWGLVWWRAETWAPRPDGIREKVVWEGMRAWWWLNVRGGWTVLNRSRAVDKWLSALVMPPPNMALAG